MEISWSGFRQVDALAGIAAEIEEVATEAELGAAFKVVMSIAFPLAGILVDTMGALAGTDKKAETTP